MPMHRRFQASLLLIPFFAIDLREVPASPRCGHVNPFETVDALLKRVYRRVQFLFDNVVKFIGLVRQFFLLIAIIIVHICYHTCLMIDLS